jgi:ATP-dependent RNA helicase DDX3X
MLDMGFEPQIYEIVVKNDMASDRLTFMFSATFPREIQKLASEFLSNYIFLTVGRVGNSSSDITQSIKYVDDKDKLEFVQNIITEIDNGLILIFVQTKQGAYDLERTFTKNGFPATSIHGDKTQSDRERALYKFKSGKCPILVATDVCSRGIDINNVTHVINYDMPNNIDDYVHRIGRTGRAGNTGSSISLMNRKNMSIAKDLFNLLEENEQEVPEWLSDMVNVKPRTTGWNNRGGRGGRGRGRGGNVRFTSRDYRREG